MTYALRLLIGIFSVSLLLTGVDYVTGNSHSMGREFGDNLWLPGVWGWTSIIVGFGTLVSVIRGSSYAAKLGCIASAAIYAMFAFQVFSVRMLPWPWPPEDHRVVVGHLAMTLFWFSSGAIILWREVVEEERQRLTKKLGGESAERRFA